MHLLLQEIRAAYTNAANPANAAPMAAYVKNVSPFFGIRSAGRKVMENAIFKATHHLDFDEVVQIAETLRAAPERELHYLAMDWLYHRRKKWTAQTISVIELLLTTKPWWDTVDFLASHCLGEWSLRFPEEGLKVIARYADSGNLWLERSAIIPQLFYREKTDTALLSGCILPHLRSKEFFHQKAIGWALRQYARTDAEWVRTFVTGNMLMPLSRREALKHLQE